MPINCQQHLMDMVIRSTLPDFVMCTDWHSVMYRPVHQSFGWVKTNMDGWWTDKKMKEQKRSSKNIDIVSDALKVSEKGVMCVFVVHFRSSSFKSL